MSSYRLVEFTLNRAWTEWAAEYGVSPTVAAAVFLMSKARPADSRGHGQTRAGRV